MINRRYLYRPPKRSHRLLVSAPRLGADAPSTLPSSVDWRAKCLPPRDQGQEGCCSGFSTAALREALHCMATNSFLNEPLSPAYLYARTRMAEHTFPGDAGATIADEMATLHDYGVCPESSLPYSGDASEAPTPQSDVAAVPFRLGPTGPIRVGWGSTISIEALKYALTTAPVVFGMPVHESFETTGPDGLVPLPGPNNTDPVLGGHAMLAVGYDNSQSRLIVRNSWGNWGSGGYCFMPMAMISSWFEAWTASPVA